MTAQPQMMRLSKADVETPVPAEVHLVPMEVHLAATETPAPVEAHLRPEEVHLAATEALWVPTRARQADAARRRTPLVIAEGTGPFLPSMPEAGATAVHSGATRPIKKSLDASASPSRHRS
jgi:hypothetical protein